MYRPYPEPDASGPNGRGQAVLTKSIAPPQVDDIIAQVYRGSLESLPWQSFLRLLRQRLSCTLAALSLRPGGDGISPVVILDRCYEITRSEAIDTAERYARLIHLDPLSNALRNPGDVYLVDEVVSREDLHRNEFYLEVMKPADIEYHMGMCIVEPSGWHCNLRLMNSREEGNFGDQEKAFLKALLPHLELALEHYSYIKRNESQLQLFRQTLDRLTIGTFILNGQGQVVDTNTVARYIATRSRCLSIENERIVCELTKSERKLYELVERALDWRNSEQTGPFVEAVRIEGLAGAHLDLLIRSVEAEDRYHSIVCPAVVVYVEDPMPHRLVPEELVAKVFGLTPTEAYLALLLSSGLTLVEAAEKMDVTENTARSYSKRIFAKMGVCRQSDLVRLILKSVVSLA